jgi:hypothetical protein
LTETRWTLTLGIDHLYLVSFFFAVIVIALL